MSTDEQYTVQTDSLLYPNALYNRPLTRYGAGRLLVVGGHSGEFSLPTAINQIALAAGLGECPVVLPDSLAKILRGAPGTYFAAANPSGSLAPESLGKIIELAQTADAVAIGASLSNNSSTAVLTEKLASQLTQPVVYFADALVALRHNVRLITDNPNALVIATMPEVFKICGALGIAISIRSGAGVVNKVEIVRGLREASRCAYLVYGTESIVAADTDLIVTPTNYRLSLVPALFYGLFSTFWVQSSSDRRAGLATAAYVGRQIGKDVPLDSTPTTTILMRALEAFLRVSDF